MTTFSCITTCKDRLHHLAKTLPATQAAGFDEIIVVDFDCPQSTADWCETHHPEVKVVKVDNRPVFNMSAARNAGGERARSKWLCFVDADVTVGKGLVPWLRENARENAFYGIDLAQIRKRKDIRGATGLLVCETAAFTAVGGYDEVFQDWGYEDIDIQLKLRAAGYVGKPFRSSLVLSCIKHDNELRTRYHQSKNRLVSHLRNKFYGVAKIKLITTFGLRPELPREVREELYEQVMSIGEQWDPANLSSIHSIEVDVPKGIRTLLEEQRAGSSLLQERLSKKLVVQRSSADKLRGDVFSRTPSVLQKIRRGFVGNL